MVHQHFVAEAAHLLFHQCRLERVRHHQLQIGPVALDLQGHQAGVIERGLLDRPQVGGGALAVAHRHGARAVMFGGEREEALHVAILHHREHGVARGVPVGGEPLVERRKAALDRAQQKNIEVAGERRVAEGDDVAIGRERGDAVVPGLGGDQLELGLEDDAGGAPGVEHELHIIAGEREDARALLHGHHFERLDHAGVADDAVPHRADAGEAAAEVAADGGDLHGRRIHHQLLAALERRLERGLDEGAGLDPDAAGLDRNHLVVAGHVEDDAALQRHRLAVVARAAAADGQRHAVAHGRGDDAGDFRFTARLDHDVGAAVLQMLGEDGAIPIEVAGLLPQLSFLRARRDVADVLPELRQRGLRNGGHLDPLKSSAAACKTTAGTIQWRATPGGNLHATYGKAYRCCRIDRHHGGCGRNGQLLARGAPLRAPPAL